MAWSGCTIMYLLGQQQHFELFDFSYQLLNVAEVENATLSLSLSSDRAKGSTFLQVQTSLSFALSRSGIQRQTGYFVLSSFAWIKNLWMILPFYQLKESLFSVFLLTVGWL